MNLLPRDRNFSSSPPSHRRKSSLRARRNQFLGTAVESSFKLGVCAMLAAVAISTLIQLVAYGFTQQANVQDIQTEVVELQERVDRLQINLNRLFDSHKAVVTMKEESGRVGSRHYRILWKAPSVKDSVPRL
jgi:outer membrane murein-binding lipoprotein Lpp